MECVVQMMVTELQFHQTRGNKFIHTLLHCSVHRLSVVFAGTYALYYKQMVVSPVEMASSVIKRLKQH